MGEGMLHHSLEIQKPHLFTPQSERLIMDQNLYPHRVHRIHCHVPAQPRGREWMSARWKKAICRFPPADGESEGGVGTGTKTGTRKEYERGHHTKRRNKYECFVLLYRDADKPGQVDNRISHKIHISAVRFSIAESSKPQLGYDRVRVDTFPQPYLTEQRHHRARLPQKYFWKQSLISQKTRSQQYLKASSLQMPGFSVSRDDGPLRRKKTTSRNSKKCIPIYPPFEHELSVKKDFSVLGRLEEGRLCRQYAAVAR